MGHRIVEHPSDVGFDAWGATFDDLLDAAVGALAEIETGGAMPSATEVRPIALDGDPEERVVRLLEHCLFLLDTEDWLGTGFRGAALVGAPLSPDARAEGTHVKAVTWHQLAVRSDEHGWRATVFVDL